MKIAVADDMSRDREQIRGAFESLAKGGWDFSGSSVF